MDKQSLKDTVNTLIDENAHDIEFQKGLIGGKHMRTCPECKKYLEMFEASIYAAYQHACEVDRVG